MTLMTTPKAPALRLDGVDTFRHDRRHDRRSGFTLFEVAISMILITFGVVSVMMVFPTVLRQLTMQRFELYASCIANQLIDVYGNADASGVYCDHEGPNSWDVPIDRKVNAPDLEMRCSNQRYGLLPLPITIARRLDSDGGEMAKLLDEGGYLYYVQPSVPTAWREDLLPVAPPNDLQRMVIGVVGSAQSNAATSLPIKRWPYYGTVPAPPLHAIHNTNVGWKRTSPGAINTPADVLALADIQRFENDAMPQEWRDAHSTYCWQACVDPDPQLKIVFKTFWDYLVIAPGAVADLPPSIPGGPNVRIFITRYHGPYMVPDVVPQVPWTDDGTPAGKQFITPDPDNVFRPALGLYLKATIDYAASSSLQKADLIQLLDTSALISNTAPFDFDAQKTDIAAKKILALNYLANSLMCLTRWHKLSDSPDYIAEALQKRPPLPYPYQSPEPDLRAAGVDLLLYYKMNPVPVYDLGPITHARITNFVRNVRYLYFRFTASHPYNWAVPRPIEHATMMDYSLLEADLFREPAAGSIWGLGGSITNPMRPSGPQALQWKYMSPTPITTVTNDPGQPLGANLTYPLSVLPGVDPVAPTAALSENGPAAGSRSHFTLLNKFEASERCRQLVFWVVDWQSYNDCETAPSAPVDAGRYPKAAPGGLKPVNAGMDAYGWNNILAPCTDFDDLMWGFTDGWGDATGLEQTINQGGDGERIKLHRALLGSYVHAYRNPEKNLMFKSSVAALATDTDIKDLKINDINASANVTNNIARKTLNSPVIATVDNATSTAPDYGPPNGPDSAPAIFSGIFGADRNGNNRLDRGPVPASVRLRAVTVARFNFYDMRVPCQIK